MSTPTQAEAQDLIDAVYFWFEPDGETSGTALCRAGTGRLLNIAVTRPVTISPEGRWRVSGSNGNGVRLQVPQTDMAAMSVASGYALAMKASAGLAFDSDPVFLAHSSGAIAFRSGMPGSTATTVVSVFGGVQALSVAGMVRSDAEAYQLRLVQTDGDPAGPDDVQLFLGSQGLSAAAASADPVAGSPAALSDDPMTFGSDTDGTNGPSAGEVMDFGRIALFTRPLTIDEIGWLDQYTYGELDAMANPAGGVGGSSFFVRGERDFFQGGFFGI